ncbi:D-2-hydroxyacid dehydrogenase [Natrononativus amylolyticus]|uniref:D-2-hydroxyacid dehydrogenase n=1 Tax=Natrononativus amylolyticus TaxID=2963434 RepID=UPI0020CB71E9|nr:D-2-hydroxyacid dehydrogenase [Natrononativus amylolyticus]
MTDELLIPHPFSREAKTTLEAELSSLEGVSVVVAETPAETRAGFETATVAMTPRLPAEWRERAERLEWAQATSAGYDHYDLEALEAAGIVLTNAAGVHAQPIAEQVLGAMLSFERELFTARDQQGDGLWLRTEGGELARKTVGIVGLGAIGGRTAELAAAVGSTVIGTKRDPSSAPAAVETVYPPEELDEVLRRAEYLVLACPLTDETRGLIDGAALETMPSDAVLVNVARGGVVEEAALVEGLQQGRIAGAALDVFEEEPLPQESPLWDLPNVLVTPHMAGSTPQYYERVAEIFRENYERFRAGDLEGMRNRIV